MFSDVSCAQREGYNFCTVFIQTVDNICLLIFYSKVGSAISFMSSIITKALKIILSYEPSYVQLAREPRGIGQHDAHDGHDQQLQQHYR